MTVRVLDIERRRLMAMNRGGRWCDDENCRNPAHLVRVVETPTGRVLVCGETMMDLRDIDHGVTTYERDRDYGPAPTYDARAERKRAKVSGARRGGT